MLELRGIRQDAIVAKLILHAVPTPCDLKEGFKPRKIKIHPFIFKNEYNNSSGIEK
jgi:hypothetical protein